MIPLIKTWSISLSLLLLSAHMTPYVAHDCNSEMCFPNCAAFPTSLASYLEVGSAILIWTGS